MTSKSISLKRNFSWTIAGNLANTLSQFGILLALTRLAGEEVVGEYALGLALTSPIFLLAGLSLRSLQVTDVEDKFAFHDYLVLRALGLMIGFAVVLGVVWIVGYTPRATSMIVLIATSKVFEGLSDLAFGVFQKREHMDLIAKSLLLKSLMTLAVFASVLIVTDSPVVATATIPAVWLFRLVAFDARQAIPLLHDGADRDVSERAQSRKARGWWSGIRSLFVLSVPAAVSAAIVSLMPNVPRYAIEWSMGTASLGIFTVLSYPLTAGNMVVFSLHQAALPRLARYYAEGRIGAFVKVLSKLLLFAGGLAAAALLVAALVSERVLDWVFGAAYSQESGVFLVLVLAMGLGFANWFLNSALHAMRAFNTMLVIQLTALLVVILSSLLLVPSLQLMGAAWVIVISMTVQIVVKSAILVKTLAPPYIRVARGV